MPKIGEQSVTFDKAIYLTAGATVVGGREGAGPLGQSFDVVIDDILAGEPSWEQAESALLKKAFELNLQKSSLTPTDIDCIFAGDLLNQCSGSVFAFKDSLRPFVGLYAACATMGLGLAQAAIMLEAGLGTRMAVAVSSHFSAAEKQFRLPLGMGSQRTPTASTTVTGGASVILCATGKATDPKVKAITTGKIIDLGITDPANMGAAMAPAAVSTLITHFKDLNIKPDYYDLIVTGDLGHVGHELVRELMEQEGYPLPQSYTDCGIMIFDKEVQDTHNGGSGPGCCGVTLAGHLLNQMQQGKLKKLLFVPTGALLSLTSSQQELSIPGIAHAVAFEV